jgi:copper chaperone
MGQTSSYTFTVAGMHCASCGMLIDETVEDLDGVRSSTTNVRKGRTTVNVDLALVSSDQVIAAIAGAGQYTAQREKP